MHPRLKKALKVVLVSLCVLVFLLIAFILWAISGRGDTSEILEGEVRQTPGVEAKALPPADELRILTWNIAYGRGPAGDESGPWTREHIESHLDKIADSIAARGADIAALQEVDLGAARSHGIHQAEYLASRLGWPYFACVVTWQQNYVPYPYWPPSRHYGEMLSGQCVLSRYPLKSNRRIRLPQPEANPFWYNMFYLHRAIQHVVVDVGSRTLPVLNVHLEAFDGPNRQRHMDRLVQEVDDLKDGHMIVLGDFNALPPEEPKRHGFEDEPDADFREDKTMNGMWTRAGFREVLAHLDPRPNTFPAETPTRRLDYLFVGSGFTLLGQTVMEKETFSDHLGIVAHVRVSD